MNEQITDIKPSFNEEQRNEFGGDYTMRRAGVTDPEQVIACDSMLNIKPGDFVNIGNPALDMQMGWWEDTKTIGAKTQFMKMTRGGWRPARSAEWSVRPELGEVFLADSTGRITMGGFDTDTLVLMVRSQESLEAYEAKTRQHSDNVQQSWEDKLSGSAAQAAHAGMGSFKAVEDTDKNGNVLTGKTQQTRGRK